MEGEGRMEGEERREGEGERRKGGEGRRVLALCLLPTYLGRVRSHDSHVTHLKELPPSRGKGRWVCKVRCPDVGLKKVQHICRQAAVKEHV